MIYNNPEYIKAKEKIQNYPIGFEFTIPFYKMTEAQKNAMNILLQDCKKDGIIELLSFDLDITGTVTEETWERIGE